MEHLGYSYFPIIENPYMGVSIVMGVPQARWLVDKGKSHLEMDDDWGYPHNRKPLYYPLVPTRLKNTAGSKNRGAQGTSHC